MNLAIHLALRHQLEHASLRLIELDSELPHDRQCSVARVLRRTDVDDVQLGHRSPPVLPRASRHT
ncbi:hypothetical protein D3C83_13540 [compost metagenome]